MKKLRDSFCRILSLIAIAVGVHTIVAAQAIAVPYKDANNKWGLLNNEGKVVSKPEFSEIEELAADKFLVVVGGKYKDGVLVDEKWGVIASDGSIMLKPIYDEIGDMINGMAPVMKNGKIGFVDSEYRLIAEPKYDFVGTPNAQGLVWVNEGGKPDEQHPGCIAKGKFGVIDRHGKIIVPVSFNSVGFISVTKFYHDELKIYHAKTDMERLMLEAGSHYALWPKPIELKPGSMFPEIIGVAFSNKLNLTHNGIADLDGKVLIKHDEFQRCAMVSDGFALVLTKKNQIGYVDGRSGNLVTNPSIRTAFSFNGNVTIGIDSRNKWNFYDIKLNQIGESYDWISPRIGGFYIVNSSNRMKLLDAASLNPIDNGHEYIFPLSHGLMAFKDSESGLWGYLNQCGKIAIPPCYVAAFSFNHGVGCVKGTDGWGMVNTDLNEVIKPRWAHMIFPQMDNFDKVWVAPEGSGAYYSCLHTATDKPAFESKYSNAWNFKTFAGEDYALVKIGNKYGQINAYGILVVPAIYIEKHYAERMLDYKISHNIALWQPIHSYRFNTVIVNEKNDYKITDILPAENWDY